MDLLDASGIEQTYLQADDEFDHQTLISQGWIGGLNVAINTTAKTLTLSSGNWSDYGVLNQQSQLLHLKGCTSSGNNGIYTSYRTASGVFYYTTTTAPSPVTEAGNGSQSIMDGHWELTVRKSKHIHSLGAKTYTTTEDLTKTATYFSTANQAIFAAANFPLPGDPAGDPRLDFVHYNDATGIKTTPPSRLLPGVVEGFYTNVRDGKIRWNRLNLGYTPYLSGASFQGMAWNAVASGYNEFNGVNRASGISYPSVMSDTPAADNFNPVPTVNAIAHREGIKDAKYLTTWDYWYYRVKTCEPDGAADSKEIVDAIKARYVVPATGSGPDDLVEFDQWEEDRDAVITEILNLIRLRGSGNLVNGVRVGKIGGVASAHVG